MVLAVAWTVVAPWSSFTAAGLVICVIEVAIGAVARTVGARNVKMTMQQSSYLFSGVLYVGRAPEPSDRPRPR